MFPYQTARTIDNYQALRKVYGEAADIPQYASDYALADGATVNIVAVGELDEMHQALVDAWPQLPTPFMSRYNTLYTWLHRSVLDTWVQAFNTAFDPPEVTREPKPEDPEATSAGSKKSL